MISNEKKNMKWGVILSYFSMFVGLVGTLLVTNRVLDYIGDYNYGLYSFVNSITTWITVLSSALAASYLRFTSIEARDNDGDVSRTNSLYFKFLFLLGLIVLIIGLSVIGIMYINGMCIGHYSFEDSKLMYLLFVYSIINISISLPASIFILFINYKKKFIYEKSILVLTEILKYLGHFLIAYYTRNILVISIYTIITTVFTLSLNFMFCKIRLKMSFSKTYFKENKSLVQSIIAFSSILILNSIVDQINSNVDKTLLGFFSKPEDVTIYSLGQQFNTYLGASSIAISSVFAPKIHELCAKDEKEEVNSLFLKVSRLQALFVCIIAFGFVSCGRDFVLWWVGPARQDAYFVGIVLMFLSIMPLSVKLSIEVQRAYNKHKFRSYLYLIVSILNIAISILFLILLPIEYSIYACLIGTVISSLICHWIGINIYNDKVIGLPMKKHYIQLLKYIFLSLLSVSFVMFLKYYIIENLDSYLLKVIIEGFSFVFVFGLLMLIFDFKYLKRILKAIKKS